jgi:hypothetical protein
MLGSRWAPPFGFCTYAKDSLVSRGPVIVFSAAIPYQGGTNHTNEQWPEYWARHFSAKGYVPVDCVRRQICSRINEHA